MDTCSLNIAGNLSTSTSIHLKQDITKYLQLFFIVLICRLRWLWWTVVIQALLRRGDFIMFIRRLSIAVLHDSILMVSTRLNANPRILLEAFCIFIPRLIQSTVPVVASQDLSSSRIPMR